MHANPLLSIAIPTCNRADFLDRCLEVHIPLARANNVQIFISDNASTDATKEIVKKRIKEYSLIRYFINEKNVGAEENVLLALNYPDTEYVWLLADNYQIQSNGIECILNLIKYNNKHTAIVLNILNQKEYLSNKDYTDRNELLSDLGAIMTCISCLVINKYLISNSNFDRYRMSCFSHVGIILEAISRGNFSVHFAKSIYVSNLVNFKQNVDSWSRTPAVFDIACDKWVNFVYSLPFYYNYDSKTKCLKDLTKVSGIFTVEHFLKLRRDKVFDYKIYKQYRHLLKLIVDINKCKLLIISLIPHIVLNKYRT